MVLNCFVMTFSHQSLTDVETYLRQNLSIPEVRTYIFPSGVPIEGLDMYWVSFWWIVCDHNLSKNSDISCSV